jgi:replicative DNA helicase
MNEIASPNSSEAERGILGCILLDPDCLGECVESITDGPGSFYDKRHSVAYSIMESMFNKGEPVDIVSFGSEVASKNLTKSIGGLAYIIDTTSDVGSTVNLPHYIKILNEKLTLRKLRIEALAVKELIDGGQTPTDELLSRLDSGLQNASLQSSKSKVRSLKEVVKEVVRNVEIASQNGGVANGISTGFKDLDAMTMGLHKGEMFVLAARPSMGKTSLGMNIVENVAVKQKIPVGVLSLEMSTQSLVMRMVCGMANLNAKRVASGDIYEKQFAAFGAACGKLFEANNIWIDDEPAITPAQVRAKAKRMVQAYGIKLLVIDYLQMIRSTIKGSVDQQGAEKSNTVKAVAKELDIPILVLAQLNREFDKDKKRKPRMSDLRESGSIEQDADVIGFLYKPEQEDDETDYEPDIQAINLFIAKQRNGATGDIGLTFFKEFTRFQDRSKVRDFDIPE